MKKALAKIQKTEINTYIDEFVKARKKYFTDGQEWLEAKVTDEKIYVQIDRKQLEEELDDMIKISLQFGKVLPLEMKIQVRKVAGGAEISYMDNGGYLHSGEWNGWLHSLDILDLFRDLSAELLKAGETKGNRTFIYIEKGIEYRQR